MDKPKFYIGIDIAADDFAVSFMTNPQEQILTKERVPNNFPGFDELLVWLSASGVVAGESVVCLEATGVYAEALCHFLHSHQFPVCIESPLKVKRAFETSGHKTDALDSRQIAEYAYRFFDELKPWAPPQVIVDKIKQLLSAREQLVRQSTASKNALKIIGRSVVQDATALEVFQCHLNQIKEHIRTIEKEIQKYLKSDPDLHQKTLLLSSVPGIGFLLIAHLAVFSNAFSKPLNYKSMAAFFGICPLKYQSGSSVYRPPKSRRYGPSIVRKVLYLASLSIATHNKMFRTYYLRKVAEGKNKKLIFNNVANKLLRLICALLKNNQPFIKNYQSINPLCLINT
jgi:transposase